MDKKKSKKANKKSKAAKSEAAKRAKNTAIMRKLDALAKEINHRLKKADENTVAIEIQMAKAKEAVKAAKLVWKDWVKENLDYSLSHIDMLCDIGGKEDPVKAKIEHKAKKAAHEKGRRAKAKAKAKSLHVEGAADDTPSAPKKSEFTAACENLARQPEKMRGQIIEAVASKMDLVVVSKVDPRFTSQSEAKVKVGPPTAKSLMVGFLAMKAQEKVMFVKQAGDHIGFTVTDPFEGSRVDGDTDGVPASFRRGGKGKGTVADQAKA